MTIPVTQQEFQDYQDRQNQFLSSLRADVTAKQIEQDQHASDLKRISGIVSNAETYIGQMKDTFEKNINEFKNQVETEITQSRNQTQDVRTNLEQVGEAANKRILELAQADADRPTQFCPLPSARR